MTSFAIGRRTFLAGVGALALAGCTSTQQTPRLAQPVAPPPPVTPPMYYALPDERFPIPEVDVAQVGRQWWRTEVDYPSVEKVGTVIVDTPNRYLYHIRPEGRAMRYGVGVGRDGFLWSGRGHIAYKREWPRWNPPNEMVARQPELEPVSIANGGMAPGLDNPLGSRALYIHQGNRDTIYRIHGSPEFWTIGRAVSSGCIRMLNQDVIHLADNVRDGSTIVVIPDPSGSQQIA
ncbi:MAG TPA: L,D-transpeptidase [Pelagibacterium sp.]|uniref:L,D-transpeptidase n=1 Tax=Pelagibacterium sp. TaxID=1967288 RepID=UPI002B5CE01A|nr:L,D-transpeptidase [Pelagibacterium sp.]HWJ87711.1 L,D-transpeptidase [Pelagibacterium sp.]